MYHESTPSTRTEHLRHMVCMHDEIIADQVLEVGSPGTRLAETRKVCLGLPCTHTYYEAVPATQKHDQPIL